jgi:DNA transformation protein and related proteins
MATSAEVRSWHIAKFFCHAKLGRCRGMADIEQASPLSIWLKLPTSSRCGRERHLRGIELLSRPLLKSSMVASDTFADFLREQLAPLGRLTMRRMFGKTGVFCDAVMFAMVTENTLYFRVDDQNRAIFKEAASFPPLNYEKKGCTIDLSFWRVPERLFDEPDELVTWARAALAAARRVATKRERTVPRRKLKRRKSKPRPG